LGLRGTHRSRFIEQFAGVLATGRTDMRKGFDGLAVRVQETLQRDPHNGHLFVFRGKNDTDHAFVRSLNIVRGWNELPLNNGLRAVVAAGIVEKMGASC
jgi:hypothetical protein